MTEELFNEVRYLDVQIKQNLAPTLGGNVVTTQLKVPIFSIQQGLAILEMVFSVDPNNIVGMTVYRVHKIYGIVRYDYRVVREVLPEELKAIVSAYQKFNRKKYIK